MINKMEIKTRIGEIDIFDSPKKELDVRIENNGITAATTFRVRKDGVNGNINLSVSSSSTGVFEDTTNTDTIVPGDLINYQVAAGATGTTMDINYIAMEVNVTGEKLLQSRDETVQRQEALLIHRDLTKGPEQLIPQF